MADLTISIGDLLGLLTVIGIAWAISQWGIARWRRRRDLEDLRADMDERRESLRKASTEYRRKREPWNP